MSVTTQDLVQKLSWLDEVQLLALNLELDRFASSEFKDIQGLHFMDERSFRCLELGKNSMVIEFLPQLRYHPLIPWVPFTALVEVPPWNLSWLGSNSCGSRLLDEVVVG